MDGTRNRTGKGEKQTVRVVPIPKTSGRRGERLQRRGKAEVKDKGGLRVQPNT